MKFILAPIVCALLCIATPLRATTPTSTDADPTRNLHALFDSEWERSLVESPENASYNGDARFNDAVLETGSVPLAAFERHIDAWIAAQNSR